jgi:hypothetical protein
MTDEAAVTTTTAAVALLRRTNSHHRRQRPQRGGSSSIITTTTTPTAAGRNSKSDLLAKIIMHHRAMATMPCCGNPYDPPSPAHSRTCKLILTTITFYLGMYIFTFIFGPIININIEEPRGKAAANNRPEEEAENKNMRISTHDYGWATLRLELLTNNEEEDDHKNTVRTGPWHRATVFIPFPASDNDGHPHGDSTNNNNNNNNNNKPASSCRPSSSFFALRLISEDAALVGILLQEEEEQSPPTSTASVVAVWRGNFTIPLPGTYAVDFRWWLSDDNDGCGDDNGATTTGKTSSSTTTTALSFMAEVPPATVPQQPDDDDDDTNSLFANGVWMSQKLLNNSVNSNNSNDLGSNSRRGSDYIWADPVTAPSLDQDHAAEEYLHIKDVGTAVAKHGTFRFPHNMYRFDELGNYELVCFWGGTIMHRIRTIFLHEKNILSKGQRPFKFHYYNITTRFQPQPDADWSTEDKERCRKCKHIFLSIDDIIDNRNDNNKTGTFSSQVEFETQLVNFVLHLQQLMNDPTFPIWILTTTNGPASKNNNRACHEQRKYPRSTDHPCNDVLKALFHPRKQEEQLPSSRLLFQPRVHLMDNTDLTLPLRLYDDDYNNNMQDMLLANIALRIFVAVGKGVADWRQNGQQGLIDGLHRNGTVEPNFVLVPYDWSSIPPPP